MYDRNLISTMCGGSWNNPNNYCRSNSRGSSNPSYRSLMLGLLGIRLTIQ